MPKIIQNGIEYASGLDQTFVNKIGMDTLDTQAQDLSGAVNELKGTLTTLESKSILSNVVKTKYEIYNGRLLITLYNAYTSASNNHGFRIDFGNSYIRFAEITNEVSALIFDLQIS